MTEPNVATSAMSLEEAILKRRSVRGFLAKPVPEDVVREVFALAQHAASGCNVQPWHVYVASGATRDRLRAAMLEKITSGVKPNPDYNYPGKFPGIYRDRQVECAVALYTEMGIGREDREGRMRASLRNFEFFDAPHVAFIGMDGRFGESVAQDVGIYLGTLMLAMTARGIGCCPQGSMRSYPDLIRAEFGVPEEIKFLAGLSFGYEDETVPANRTRTTRADLDESVAFKV